MAKRMSSNVVQMVHVAVITGTDRDDFALLGDMSPEQFKQKLEQLQGKYPEGCFVHSGRQFENDIPEYTIQWVHPEGAEPEEDFAIDATTRFEIWRKAQPLKRRRIHRPDGNVPDVDTVTVVNIGSADLYVEGGVRIPAFDPDGERTGTQTVPLTPTVQQLIAARKLVRAA